MIIEKILICGSTYLTELVVDKLKDKYELVGYVPSVNPTKKGNIKLPRVDINSLCDIKLSIQYDKLITDTQKCFNVHTGLLPEYGGTNILSYTIKNKEKKQGLTFHKVTDRLDFGPIISKITYPVFPMDEPFDLYKKLLSIGPNFVLSSLELLKNLDYSLLKLCETKKPILYKRGGYITDERIKNYDR